ncbi:Flagellar brake protein YcgR [compost metagenome]
MLQVQLEIRHLIPVQHKNGQESIRAGCCFANMNTPRETMVQRYVANLERERRALVR